MKQNLTLPVVAKMIGSNRTHLSYVLNVHLDLTFTNYLKILRIKYITNLLLEDSKYLNFKIESLAEKCGMANRQIFLGTFSGNQRNQTHRFYSQKTGRNKEKVIICFLSPTFTLQKNNTYERA